MTTSPSREDNRSELVVSEGRRELGRLEEAIVAMRWAWDVQLSHRVDHLLVLIEADRP